MHYQNLITPKLSEIYESQANELHRSFQTNFQNVSVKKLIDRLPPSPHSYAYSCKYAGDWASFGVESTTLGK